MDDFRTAQIGGHSYEIRHLPPRQAIRVFRRVVAPLIPGIGRLANDVFAKGEVPESLADLDLSRIDFEGLAAMLVDRMDEDHIIQAMDWMAEKTMVQG